MKRKSNETKLCIAFAEHCELYFPRQRGILNWTHIANEGRSPQEGSKLKKMGVHAGWFDYEFIWHQDYARIGFLEAKWDKGDYSPSQKTFSSVMAPMGVLLEKFYSVKQGHEILLSWGIKPMRECRLFKEPNTMTWEDKVKNAVDWNRP